MTINKDVAITYLKEINKGKEHPDITTRLYYGEGKYVQDFSYYATENYMSQELLEALGSCQTLTIELDKELLDFVNEKTIN